MPSLSINGLHYSISEADVTGSLLDVIRDRCHLSGTKEGCGSGDCGACTVMFGRGHDVITLNSCITPAGAVLEGNIITADGIAEILGDLHPVQAAMLEGHGAQCGFCTPGFVVSMVADQLSDAAEPTRQRIIASIGGNLCRCTGYRPIVDAGIKAALDPRAQDANQALRAVLRQVPPSQETPRYLRPHSEPELRTARAEYPSRATFVAGSTDLWLRYTQHYEDFGALVDGTQLAVWRGVEAHAEVIEMGALTTHAELLSFFSQAQWRPQYGAIADMLHRFGSPQIRARGTIGGNVANASPVADWPPVLLALDAELELVNAAEHSRWLPVREFFLGYRATALGEQELIRRFRFRRLTQHEELLVFKVSKRYEDDISTVLGAFRIRSGSAGEWQQADVGLGGMASTPLYAAAVGDLLVHRGVLPFDEPFLAQIAALLQPISDVRGSAEYRIAMVLEMIQRLRDQRTEDLYAV